MTDALSLRLLGLLAALAALGGCSELDNCPDSKDPIPIETGMSDASAFTYESAPDDVLDAFPAKTVLTFKHELGFTPLIVEPYLAFSKDGTNGKGGGSIALSAGNQTLIECKDAHVIVIKNDTCEPNFFIKVAAYGKAPIDNGESCSK
jgi:hypothetical protein